MVSTHSSALHPNQPPIGEKKSITGRLWSLREVNERLSLAISQQYSLPLLLAEIIARRGHTLESAYDFLKPTLKSLLPDPSHLKDLNRGVKRLIDAILTQQKLVVFADYDVDGATASALLRRYFQDIGVECGLYIPNRIEEGYGPNVPAIHHLKAQGYDVMIMVDCGSTAFEPLQTASDLKLDTIIIDHHVTQPKLPEVYALINPNRFDEDSPLTHLCAAGLAFVFLVGLHRQLRQYNWFDNRPEPDLRQYLDLVALGTVCDVMPLTGLNRAYVTQGLRVMTQRGNLGINQLLDCAGLEEIPSAYHLGFILGPRINAGGRVGQADFGSRLLTTQHLPEAQYLAEQLELYNKERQVIESQVIEEALEQIHQKKLDHNPLIMVAGHNWHPGVIGIVASRLKERFNRPACVVGFAQGVGKGSGRSIPGFSLGSAMHTACHQGLLLYGGGHAMAAGFTVAQEKYEEFYGYLLSCFDDLPVLETSYELDGLLALSAISVDFVQQLGKLEPYGNGNPAPRFGFHRIKIGYTTIVGQHHIKVDLVGEDGVCVKAMAFRAVDTPLGDFLLKNRHQFCHVVGTLKLNTWLGKTDVTLIIEDIITLA
jgi:single-stranded-DNA-specific exonuclease